MAFPVEMTHYTSWIVWKYLNLPGRAKPAKMPYSPLTGRAADTTDPNDWTTYSHAKQYLEEHPGEFAGLGFVFSDRDPYTGIDLDEPTNDAQRAYMHNVLGLFSNTYQERSPSKTGFHIIVRGKVANERKINTPEGIVEIYPRERYFAMTGDTINDVMIDENDFGLIHLWWSLGGSKELMQTLVEGKDQKYTDEDIYRMGCDASQGHKFKDLFHGRWSEYYTDQSRADQALVNMISFYSRNVDQIRRMFFASELGKRPKASRPPSKQGKLSYLDQMVQNSFDNLAPDISIDSLLSNFDKVLEDEKREMKENPKPMLGEGWTLPPGLLGEIAEFIYQAAPRPVKEIALAGAIAFMAGIAGRAYNVTNTGLNHYILVLAGTGVGKEAIKSGTSRIIKEVKKHVPVAGGFIGPATMSSGQALTKYLSTNACFVSILGEFGLTLQRICGPMANSSDIQLRAVLLDIYNKSGIHNDLQQSIYSDKANNTDVVQAPNMSLIGETTPASYFPFLDDYMISQGLIPRFTCIEYDGPRPPKNKAHAHVVPSEALVSKIVALMSNSLSCQQYGTAVQVGMTEEAEAYIDAFDKYCDAKSNVAEEGVGKHMWTRGDVKLQKLAALIAVGENVYEPVITLEHAAWARNVVEKDILNIVARFAQGQVGADSQETQQVFAVGGIMRDYAVRDYDALLEKYQVDRDMHKQHIITLTYLQRRLAQRALFSKDKAGSTRAMERALRTLLDEGAIVEMKPHTMNERFSSMAKAYGFVDIRRFSDVII